MTRLIVFVVLFVVCADAALAERGSKCGTHSRSCMSATLFNWWEAPQPLGELGDIVTDRPDFTEASSTVGLGVAQLEAGYTFTLDGDDQGHSWGEPLLRVGLFANWFEFRIGVAPVSQSSLVGTQRLTQSGAEDLYLGAKIGLTPQDGILPELAIIPQMTVPTGGAAFSDGQVHPGANLLYAWDITDEFSFAGSTQYNSAIDGLTDRYAEWAQSLTVGASVTEDVGVYAEWFAFFPHSADTVKPEHYMNGGFSYLLNQDVQFDIRAGLGLNDEADDFFVGTGFSIRFR